jgi:GntR family transcriptional regulator
MVTLGLSSDSRVVRITPLQCSAGPPLAIERICLSSEFLPDARTGTSSICNTLADANFRPVRAIQRTFALNIEDPDATLLGVAIGTAGLLTKRVAYLASGRAIEFNRSLFRGDAEGFVSELTFLDN